MHYCIKILNEQLRVAVLRYQNRHQKHRRKSCLTQADMAENLRVSLREYSNHVRGKSGFSMLSSFSFLFLLLDRPEYKNNEELITLLRDLREAVEEAEKTSE